MLAPGPVDARLIAACDVAYEVGGNRAFAATVVVERDSWREVDRATSTMTAPAKYDPGRFALREAACLIPTLEALATRPDVILIDGHGIAHPRRFGLACHIGLAFDVPTIGCAKNILHGTPTSALGEEQGSVATIADASGVIGALVRTRTGVKPVCVSPGHLFDVASSVALVATVAPQFRIPEPLRQAHQLSNRLRANPHGS